MTAPIPPTGPHTGSRPGPQITATRISAPTFDDLRTRLVAATAEQLDATAAYWAALPGLIAAEHRHLIDEEIEVRQAVAHDIETAHAALVAAMAPTTRWEAQR